MAAVTKKETTKFSSSSEDEMERISLGSAESIAVSEESEEEEKKPKKKKTPRNASKKAAVKKPKKKSKSPASSEPAPAPASAPTAAEVKKKNGRPKLKKPAKIISQESSPVKKTHNGRPARAVNHFVGGQKHALVAKKIFTDARVAIDQRPKAIVIERAVFDPEKMRRKRVPWTEEETENLAIGVEKHGEGFWADIFNDPELYFNESRTQIDLKDKWRNMTSYIKYQEHPIRKFVLVDSTHQMIRSDAGNLHVFRNRWPRDAALKAATKDEFYPLDENNERTSTTLIHIKELLDQEGKRERPLIVHVYRVTRVLERPKNVKKFDGYAAVWVGKVEKVAEEIMIRQEEVLTPEDEKLIEIQRRQEMLLRGETESD